MRENTYGEDESRTCDSCPVRGSNTAMGCHRCHRAGKPARCRGFPASSRGPGAFRPVGAAPHGPFADCLSRIVAGAPPGPPPLNRLARERRHCPLSRARPPRSARSPPSRSGHRYPLRRTRKRSCLPARSHPDPNRPPRSQPAVDGGRAARCTEAIRDIAEDFVARVEELLNKTHTPATDLVATVAELGRLTEEAAAALVVRQRSQGKPLKELTPSLGLTEDRPRKKYHPPGRRPATGRAQPAATRWRGKPPARGRLRSAEPEEPAPAA